MHAEVLMEFSLEYIGAAIKNIQRNPKYKFMPMAAEIRAEIFNIPMEAK